MKVYLVLALLLTSNAFACWNMKAVLSVDSKVVLVDQKIEHDKIYSFASEPYIFHVIVPSKKGASGHLISVDVVEKNGIGLASVATAQMIVETGTEASMTQLDIKTNQLTSIKVTLTEI